MKNRNIAIDNGKAEVGDRNVAETEKTFHASLIKLDKENPEIDREETKIREYKY